MMEYLQMWVVSWVILDICSIWDTGGYGVFQVIMNDRTWTLQDKKVLYVLVVIFTIPILVLFLIGKLHDAVLKRMNK